MSKKSNSLNEDPQSLQNIYAALGHAIRYDIINYLGTFHRPIQYTELVDWLQIRPGSFYFHMKKLKNLVEQDSDKRFYLTSIGQLALEVIRSGENLQTRYQSIDSLSEDIEIIPPKRFSIILFGEFIRKLTFNTKFKIFMLVIIISQILLLELAKLGTIPFYLDGNLYFSLIGCIFQVIGSITIVWILLELIMRYFSPIKHFSTELLAGIPLAMSPLFLYPALVILAQNFNFFAVFVSNPTISIGIIFILQIITAYFLVQLLQVIKSVNFERALVPVFLILYAFSIVSFLISTIFPL